jgi:phosphatidate cytidylyltransferase
MPPGTAALENFQVNQIIMRSALSRRLSVVIVLIPLGVAVIAAGGWIYTLVVVGVLGVAAWEYWRMFVQGGYKPSIFLLLTGVTLFVLTRFLYQFQGSDIVISLSVLAAMAFHLVGFERGQEKAAVDFNVTLGGILYLGWIGSYFIMLRSLPDGLWWVMLALPAVWLADGGAYFVGSRFGRHKMAPRVSPAKSWEGYFGGIVTGVLGSMGLAFLWHLRAPGITVQNGFILGLVLSVITPIGDLGESMLKRQFGVKDTSNLLPGHGGVMDRIDSWLWAVVISYYLILWIHG